MTQTTSADSVKFRVLDAMDAPHEGRILRLRLQSGETPTVRRIKGSRLRAVSPDGDAERTVEVKGFAVFGGRPSDERLARTGRIDVHVVEADSDPGTPPIGLRWEVVLDD